MRAGLVVVESDEQARDTKGAHTARLGVALLNAGNVASDILDADGVLDCEAVRLALHSRAVNQNTGVGGEACGARALMASARLVRREVAGQKGRAEGPERRTGKAEADVVIEHGRLAHRPRVLQLEDRLLLDGEDDAVLAADADGARPLADGFLRVVDLFAVPSGSASRMHGMGRVRTWKR